MYSISVLSAHSKSMERTSAQMTLTIIIKAEWTMNLKKKKNYIFDIFRALISFGRGILKDLQTLSWGGGKWYKISSSLFEHT